jgi:hypothetical protein
MITEGSKLIWYRAKSTANWVCKIYTMEQPHMTKGNTEANQLVWPILKELSQCGTLKTVSYTCLAPPS